MPKTELFENQDEAGMHRRRALGINRSKIVEDAIECGRENYLSEGRLRITDFVEGNFSFQNSLRLHKICLGKDIPRSAANLVAAPLDLVIGLGAKTADGLGKNQVRDRLKGINLQQETDLQKEISLRIYRDLLVLPFENDRGSCAEDGLLAKILEHPDIVSAWEDAVAAYEAASEDVRQRLDTQVGELMNSRTAHQDMFGTVALLVAGAACGKFVPGAVEASSAAAAAAAHSAAVASFPLGSGIGGAFYGAFPGLVAGPSTVVLTSAFIGVMSVMAVAATFSGIITDPILARTGIHEKRLETLFDEIDAGLTRSESDPKPMYDAYFARAMDIVDSLLQVKKILT